MRILAIDPGHTTGWCKIEVEDEKPKYVFSGNIDHEKSFSHAIHSLLNDLSLTKTIVERPPYNLPPIMGRVVGDVILAICERPMTYVSPAEWKPITGRYPLPKLDWRTTRHERDAWRMGVFWLWKEGLIRLDTVPHTL